MCAYEMYVYMYVYMYPECMYIHEAVVCMCVKSFCVSSFVLFLFSMLCVVHYARDCSCTG